MCGAELKSLPEGVQRVARVLQDKGHPHAPQMLNDAARTARLGDRLPFGPTLHHHGIIRAGSLLEALQQGLLRIRGIGLAIGEMAVVRVLQGFASLLLGRARAPYARRLRQIAEDLY